MPLASFYIVIYYRYFLQLLPRIRNFTTRVLKQNITYNLYISYIQSNGNTISYLKFYGSKQDFFMKKYRFSCIALLITIVLIKYTRI